MPTPVYHNGADGRAWSKPGATGTHVEFAVTKWDLRITANNQQVSNAKDGRKRIAGVADVSGSATLHYDSANQPHDVTTGPGLKHGALVALELGTDVGADVTPTKCFRLNALIGEFHISSDFEGTLDADVTFEIETGSTLKYPGDA
jgi:hypothetical protein